MTRNTLTALLLTAILAPAVVHGAPDFAERPEVRNFVTEMADRHGFPPDELLALFRQATPDTAVLKAIAPPAQPGIRSWRAYRDRFVEPKRIAAGLAFWGRHAATLDRAEAAYGVPSEIVVAIIGIETIYGQHTGRFRTFNALTNLAFDYPPRAELFRRELEALLLLAREEQRDPLSYLGSYAGALGLPQFLPSSVREYAIDFDGDGRIDLSGNPDDAIGSVARFLNHHGWVSGATASCPALTEGNVAPLIAEGIKPQRLPAELEALGVKVAGAPAEPAALIDLETPGEATEYRLGFTNFYVLTRYNRSTFYASAVLDLAQALRSSRRATAAASE